MSGRQFQSLEYEPRSLESNRLSNKGQKELISLYLSFSSFLPPSHPSFLPFSFSCALLLCLSFFYFFLSLPSFLSFFLFSFKVILPRGGEDSPLSPSLRLKFPACPFRLLKITVCVPVALSFLGDEESGQEGGRHGKRS